MKVFTKCFNLEPFLFLHYHGQGPNLLSHFDPLSLALMCSVASKYYLENQGEFMVGKAGNQFLELALENVFKM